MQRLRSKTKVRRASTPGLRHHRGNIHGEEAPNPDVRHFSYCADYRTGPSRSKTIEALFHWMKFLDFAVSHAPACGVTIVLKVGGKAAKVLHSHGTN
jgi:hypothetical protein